jgi:hypothetical protein
MTEIPTQPRKDVTNKELLEKMDVVSRDICDLDVSVKSLRGYIVGDIGNGDTIGLAERVRRIEEWIAARKRLESILIGAIIIEAVGFVLIAINVVSSHIV